MTSERHPTTAKPATVQRFARRTERLEPLYDSVRFALTWSFRIGAALLLIGIALAVLQRQPLNHVTEGFEQVLPGVLRGDADAVIDLAILWLMVSPVLVVTIVAAGFFRLGERKYALLSVLVLIVLGVSIALALAQ
jgi:uncharacterized membrane protein